jgi:hypothetical protein
MAQNTQTVSLQAKHAALEEIVRAEQTRVRPDGLVIRQLKRQKLRIKDALSRLLAQRHPPMGQSSVGA